MKIGRIFKAYEGAGFTADDLGNLVINGKDYLTRKVQILAKTGQGKSYTASKICEELLKEGLPICVVDPVSVYWGLKEKYKIIVFGDHRNKHADYALTDDKETIEPQAEMIADFVANSTESVIIDLSRWPEYKQQKFGAAFASRLYLENKIPRHVFIEEADIFVPQTVNYPDEIASRHAFDTLIRRGRMQGLGATVISQRPAVVSKNILSQSDLSIYLHLKDASDLEPARKEINNDEDLSKDEQTAIIKSIKSMQRGNAFFYSSAWLKLKAFVAVDAKETYHAGATRGEPDFREDKDVKLVPVDLATLEGKLAEFAQKKEEQPQAPASKHGKKQETLFTNAADALKIQNLEAELAVVRKELAATNEFYAAAQESLAQTNEQLMLAQDKLKDFEALKIVLSKLVQPKEHGGPAEPIVETIPFRATTSPDPAQLIRRAIKEGKIQSGRVLRMGAFDKATQRYGHKFKPEEIKSALEQLAREDVIEIVLYGKGKTDKFYKVKKEAAKA